MSLLFWSLAAMPPAHGPAAAPRLALSVLPNPARGAVTLGIELPAPGDVRCTIHDVRGRLVRTLAGAWAAGPALLSWDGRDDRGAPAPRGTYFVRLRAPGVDASARTVRR
jgi:hypothetical protein